MTLKKGALDKNGAILTSAQVDRLLSATRGTHPDHAIAMCHVPHNAFMFYDASHAPVGFVEICFTCLSTRVEPVGAAPNPDLLALAEIFAEHHLPLGEYADLEAFKRHYNETNEMFHKKVPVQTRPNYSLQRTAANRHAVD